MVSEAAESERTATELRRLLLESAMPEPTVPATFASSTRCRRSASGKIDRKSLPKPSGSRSMRDGDFRPPRTPLESRMAALWQELLEVESIGIADNFFEFGGDSLLAVKLVVMLEERLGITLALSDLVQAPTIEKLRERLGIRTNASSAASIVCMQSAGNALPLFCVPGVSPLESAIFGSSSCFADLAEHFAPEQPFFSFWLHYDTAGAEKPGRNAMSETAAHATIGKIATDLLRDIQLQQPRGPYRLVGYSFGGLIAYEMACRLHAMGETGSRIAGKLLDVPTGAGLPRPESGGLRRIGTSRTQMATCLSRSGRCTFWSPLQTSIRYGRTAVASRSAGRRRWLDAADPGRFVAAVRKAYLSSLKPVRRVR